MRPVRLASEVLGALGAGALAVVIARQVGLRFPRAFGVVAAVPVIVAALLAVPSLWEGGRILLDQRRENANVSAEEAQIKAGADLGIATNFFEWAHTFMKPDETFHLEIGAIPTEIYNEGVGYRQAAILQWGLFQLAPNVAFEQSSKARDLKPGEGRNADWIVFYEWNPSDFPATLGDVTTYAPGFAIARTAHAR